jgi:hypothetical protein
MWQDMADSAAPWLRDLATTAIRNPGLYAVKGCKEVIMQDFFRQIQEEVFTALEKCNSKINTLREKARSASESEQLTLLATLVSVSLAVARNFILMDPAVLNVADILRRVETSTHVDELRMHIKDLADEVSSTTIKHLIRMGVEPSQAGVMLEQLFSDIGAARKDEVS